MITREIMVAQGAVNSRQKSHFQTNIHMTSIHRAMVSSTSPSPILHVHESVNILFELFAFSRSMGVGHLGHE